jgi:hypothetical protein
VGSPTAVAYVGEDGGRYNLQYTTRVENEEVVVAFDLPTLGFQLEYYDALPIDPSGGRAYDFAYAANYPVRDLVFEVQVPPTAEGFELDPEAGEVQAGADELLYHRLRAGPLAQGETFELSFRYSKEGDELTSSGSQQPPAAGAPSTEEPAAGEGGSTVALFVVAFVALLGVGIGAYWLGQRTQSPAPQAPVRRPRRRGGGGGGSRQKTFCHKCGVELRPDSEFCHGCGAQVRSE